MTMIMTSEMADFLKSLPVGEKTPSPDHNSEIYKDYIALRENHLVKENILGECEITQAGISALAQYERQQDIMRQQATAQRAEEERRVREKRHDRGHNWLVAIVGAIIAGIVVFLVTRRIP